MSVNQQQRRQRTGTGVATAFLVALCLVPAAAQDGTRPRLCPQDAPEGVRLPSRPGCDTVSERQRSSGDGFRDLGNGVSLKLGGRARLDVETRR